MQCFEQRKGLGLNRNGEDPAGCQEVYEEAGVKVGVIRGEYLKSKSVSFPVLPWVSLIPTLVSLHLNPSPQADPFYLFSVIVLV